MERYPVEITGFPSPFVLFQGLDEPDQPDGPISDDACLRLASPANDRSPFYETLHDPQRLIIERKVNNAQGPIASKLVESLQLHNIANRPMPDVNGKEFSKRSMFKIGYSGSHFCLPKDSDDAPSVLSPFDQKSPYYGTLLPLEWIQKQRSVVPSVLVAVYQLADSAQDDRTMMDELGSLKARLETKHIKLMTLLIAEETDDDTEQRIDRIRIEANLAKTGIVFLHSKVPKEIAAFVESLLYTIRLWCTEYYSAYEKDIKKRVPPIADYNETFWLARQAIKTAVLEEIVGVSESSARLLEYAYEKLIVAIQAVDMVDTPNLWCQCRSLLDLVGMHITKAYFFLLDPNMAYKKFDIHVQNVRAIVADTQSYALSSWLALQSTWFVQLLELVPESIIPIERPLLPSVSAKWFKSTSNTSTISPSLPQGGYIAMQAALLMRQRREQSLSKYTPRDPYLSLAPDAEAKFDHGKQAIQLLNWSLKFFGKASRTKFSRTESFDYYLIGEEYFARKNYSMAANNYMVALSTYQDEKWLSIISRIEYRLFLCATKLKNNRDAQAFFLKLSRLPERYITHFKHSIENHSFGSLDHDVEDDTDAEDVTNEGRLVYKGSVFDTSVALKKQSLLLSEHIVFQVVLTSNFNSLVENGVVNAIHIQLGESTVTVKHNSGAEVHRFGIFKSDEKVQEYQFEANLVFTKDSPTHVLQFELLTKLIGQSRIKSVNLEVNTLSFEFQNRINLSLNQHPSKWYSKQVNGLGKDIEFEVLPYRKDPFFFEVIPKQPEIDVRLKYSEFAYNGQIFPVCVHFHNKDVDSYGLAFEARASVEGEQMDVEWQGSEIAEFKSQEVEERTMLVHLPTLKDIPTILNAQSENNAGARRVVKVTFTFTYDILKETNVSVKANRVLEVPIMEIFKFEFNIHPGIESEIPSVFDVNDNVTTIPTHNRMWEATCTLLNVSYMPLQVSDCKLELKTLSSNAHADLTKQPSGALIELDDLYEIPFSFVSYCESNYLKRAIQVEIFLTFNFQDKSGSIVNSRRALLWKGSLPHMDPRILVTLKDLGDHELIISYVLENPTGRVFQFSCTLSASEYFEIYSHKNQKSFVVLPFSKERIQFRYRVLEEFIEQRLIRLPEFKVYDLNFKVYLNQLVVTDRIETQKGSMFYKQVK